MSSQPIESEYTMGHYASEIGHERSLSGDEREAKEVHDTLGARGYVGPAVKHYTNTIHVSRYISSAPLLHHEPCGSAVFDPNMHDKYCPANRYAILRRILKMIRHTFNQ